MKLAFGEAGWIVTFFVPSGNEAALKAENDLKKETCETILDVWRKLRDTLGCDLEEFQERLIKKDSSWRKHFLWARWVQWKQNAEKSNS